MRKTIVSTLFMMVMTLGLVGANGQDADSIKQLINIAYVEGIHNQGNLNDTRNGFHPAFQMFVLRNGVVSTVSIDQWIQRIEQGRSRNPNTATERASARYLSIDIAGEAASVKLELHRGDQVLFTDYLLLYRLNGQWKIVSKAYQVH